MTVCAIADDSFGARDTDGSGRRREAEDFVKTVSTGRAGLPLCLQVRSMPGLLERVGAKTNLV